MWAGLVGTIGVNVKIARNILQNILKRKQILSKRIQKESKKIPEKKQKESENPSKRNQKESTRKQPIPSQLILKSQSKQGEFPCVDSS